MSSTALQIVEHFETSVGIPDAEKESCEKLLALYSINSLPKGITPINYKESIKRHKRYTTKNDSSAVCTAIPVAIP